VAALLVLLAATVTGIVLPEGGNLATNIDTGRTGSPGLGDSHSALCLGPLSSRGPWGQGDSAAADAGGSPIGVLESGRYAEAGCRGAGRGEQEEVGDGNWTTLGCEYPDAVARRRAQEPPVAASGSPYAVLGREDAIMPDDSNRMAGLGGSDADGRASAETEGGSPGAWPAIASHYGTQYDTDPGSPLGCGAMLDLPPTTGVWPAQAPDGSCPGAGLTAGVYRSCDQLIVAVGPAHYADIPCGTWLRVCASNTNRGLDAPAAAPGSGDGQVPNVRCLVVSRSDSCPGCSSQPLGEYIDLSESGLFFLCGGECSVLSVTVEVIP